MDNTQSIYKSVLKFIDKAVLSINDGVPNNDIKLEIVYETQEWTGIRIMRTPSARALREFIDGRKEVEFNIQLASRQTIDSEKKIQYSAFLDKLAGVIESLFETDGPHPVEGVIFKSVSIAGGSNMIPVDGKISMYALDVKFVYVV